MVVTKLRLARIMQGRRLIEAARELGIPAASLSRVENARSYVPPRWREKLAAYYGLSGPELWDSLGWPVVVEGEQLTEK